MKIFCEYCGNRIDTSVESKCPSCGATYRRNKEFLKLEEERRKEQELNNEYKNKIFNHTFGVFKFSKFFLLIPIVFFVVILITFISVFSNFGKNSFFDSLTSQTNFQPVAVKLGEYASTKHYKVKVTKYEVIDDHFNKLEEDYELVRFYLVVENTSGKQIEKEDVNCIINGIAQTNEFSYGYSTIPMFINKGLAVKGTATFEVPKDATSYDIKYGDNITIHIQK